MIDTIKHPIKLYQTLSVGITPNSTNSMPKQSSPMPKQLSHTDPPLSQEAQQLAQQNAAVNKYTEDVQKAYNAQQRMQSQQTDTNPKKSTKSEQTSVASLPTPKQAVQTLTRGPGGATIVSQRALYSKVAAKHQLILDALYNGLTSKNEITRLNAAKILLNKILPDLKAVEVGGEVNPDGTRQAIQLFVDTGRGFIPATVTTSATSVGSIATESQTLQNTDLAQTGTENDNSDIRDSEAGSS